MVVRLVIQLCPCLVRHAFHRFRERVLEIGISNQFSGPFDDRARAQKLEGDDVVVGIEIN
jgi:hypothetical protein